MVFDLDLWFERYHRLKKHVSGKPVHARPLSFDSDFITHRATTEKVFYMDGKVSSISQMGVQRNSILSPTSKYMNGFAARHQLHQRPFCFFTFMKSYCNHGYGLTTQNPWLWVNHIKPKIMVRGQPHKTHSYGYGSTTQNPWLGVNHTKPMVKGQPHKTHSCDYGSTTQNPRLWAIDTL